MDHKDWERLAREQMWTEKKSMGKAGILQCGGLGSAGD